MCVLFSGGALSEGLALPVAGEELPSNSFRCTANFGDTEEGMIVCLASCCTSYLDERCLLLLIVFYNKGKQNDCHALVEKLEVVLSTKN